VALVSADASHFTLGDADRIKHHVNLFTDLVVPTRPQVSDGLFFLLALHLVLFINFLDDLLKVASELIRRKIALCDLESS